MVTHASRGIFVLSDTSRFRVKCRQSVSSPPLLLLVQLRAGGSRRGELLPPGSRDTGHGIPQASPSRVVRVCSTSKEVAVAEAEAVEVVAQTTTTTSVNPPPDCWRDEGAQLRRRGLAAGVNHAPPLQSLKTVHSGGYPHRIAVMAALEQHV